MQNKSFLKIDLLQSYTSVVQPMQDKTYPTFYYAKNALETPAILIPSSLKNLTTHCGQHMLNDTKS